MQANMLGAANQGMKLLRRVLTAELLISYSEALVSYSQAEQQISKLRSLSSTRCLGRTQARLGTAPTAPRR